VKQLQILTEAFPISLDHFSGPKKFSAEMLHVNSVPKFLLGKTAEREGQMSFSYSSSNTGNIYVMQPFLENIAVLERGQFLPAICIYLSSSSGKIKNLKEPTAWLQVKVFLQIECLEC